MVGWPSRVVLGAVLAVIAMFVLVSVDGVPQRPAAAASPSFGPPAPVALVPPSPCPTRGVFENALVGSDSLAASAVARAFAADWFGHRPAAAMALADPVFVNDARQEAEGPRLPIAHFVATRVTPLMRGRFKLYRCGDAVDRAALAVDVTRAGTNVGATIWVVKRPQGFKVWAVR